MGENTDRNESDTSETGFEDESGVSGGREAARESQSDGYDSGLADVGTSVSARSDLDAEIMNGEMAIDNDTARASGDESESHARGKTASSSNLASRGGGGSKRRR